jgi:CBS domain containing-hemolysin-like protein
VTSGEVWHVLAVIGLVLLAGILSCVDAAIARFSPARAEELYEAGRPGSGHLLHVAQDQAPHIAALLLARITVEVGAVVLTTSWVIGRFGNSASVIWPLVIVAALVWFGVVDVSPRTVGRRNADRVALWAAPALALLTRILGPLPALLILLTNVLTPGRGYAEGPFSSESELREAVDLASASELIEDVERKMIHSVFELGDTVTREVMVPRPDVVFIERHKNLRQTMSLFLRSGFSRMPVVEENLDDIVGVAYFKDVAKFNFDHPQAELTTSIDKVMREAHFVPESKPVDEVLTQMQTERQHVTIVVDEYGGTAGLLTIEDILEEIVGEIEDEHDEGSAEVELVKDGLYRVSARFLIDDLDELLGREVLDDDVDSVLGLMAKQMGRVPVPGAVIEAYGVRFEAERAAGRRNQVHTVLVSDSSANKLDA